MVHSPHSTVLGPQAPPEASTVHVVCLAEGHPNSPSIKRSKRDLRAESVQMSGTGLMSAAPPTLSKMSPEQGGQKIGVASNRLSFELSRVELQGVRVAESIDHHAN